MRQNSKESGRFCGLAWHQIGVLEGATPVLLLPGLLDDAGTLRRLMRGLVLGLGRPVLCVEPLGAGGSDAPEDAAAYALPGQAERLVALLRGLRNSKVDARPSASLRAIDAIGLSMGGMWLQHALCLAPEVFGKVVLCATAAEIDPRLGCICDGLRGQLDAGVPDDVLTRSLLPYLFSPRFLLRPSTLPMLLALFAARRPANHALRGQLAALRAHDLGARLGDGLRASGARVALIQGGDDMLIAAPTQERLAEVCGVAPRVLAGLGHCLWLEDPDGLVGAIAAALREEGGA